ncbi:MAG: hypothetical protein WCI72_02710 [archaeon]
MAKIYEVTTIESATQRYEVIEVSPIVFANNESGVSISTLECDGKFLEGLAGHVHSVFAMTGLENAIKSHPAQLITQHDGTRFTGAQIAEPERLRLIYETFSMGSYVPILRVCPVEGEQIFLAEYDFTKVALPLKKMSVSPEFEGSLDMQFTGLRVFLHLRNFEAENEHYYGRNLRKSCNIKF